MDKQSGDSFDIKVVTLLISMDKCGTQRGVETPDTQQEVKLGQGHYCKNLLMSSSTKYYPLIIWMDEEQQRLVVSHMKPD